MNGCRLAICIISLLQLPTTVVISYWHNYEKRYCFGGHKQCKTILKDHMARLKIISLYIFKDLRLRILGHEDGDLVPSPRCGFSFEVAFQL